MAKFRYRPILHIVEKEYETNTGVSIYEGIGKVDFRKAKLLIEAETPEESEKIRMGFTDIRMWELENQED